MWEKSCSGFSSLSARKHCRSKARTLGPGAWGRFQGRASESNHSESFLDTAAQEPSSHLALRVLVFPSIWCHHQDINCSKFIHALVLLLLFFKRQLQLNCGCEQETSEDKATIYVTGATLCDYCGEYSGLLIRGEHRAQTPGSVSLRAGSCVHYHHCRSFLSTDSSFQF